MNLQLWDMYIAGKVPKKSQGQIRGKPLEILLASYNTDPKPSKQVYEQLVQETGLELNRVKNWFQNKRAKQKREDRDTVSPIASTPETFSVVNSDHHDGEFIRLTESPLTIS